METDLQGQVYSLLAALTWAVAVVLFKTSGERISPLALNLLKNSVGTLILGVTVLVSSIASPADFQTVISHPPGDICLLLLSGFLGITLADTLFFKGLNLIGVGLSSVIDCLYSPVVIVFAYLFWSEELSGYHYLGGLFILAAVLSCTKHKLPPDRTRGQIMWGMFLAASAIVLLSVGIVMAKPVIVDFPLWWSTFLRLFFGTICVFPIVFCTPNRRQTLAVFRPSAVWKHAIPAAVLGTYLAMVFWVAGFKYTSASVAAMLNQTSTVLATILAAIFLKEHLTIRKVASLAIALTGVAIVTFKDYLEATFGPLFLRTFGA